MLSTSKHQPYFLADTTVNIDPTAEDIADITLQAAELAERFDVTAPRRPALVFEFRQQPRAVGKQDADCVEHRRERRPDLMVDGEMQADTAVVPEIIEGHLPLQLAQGRCERVDLPRSQFR
jgi:malate dehydrogenase (oxaloacetate-decarboxylating)(NADP+)